MGSNREGADLFLFQAFAQKVVHPLVREVSVDNDIAFSRATSVPIAVALRKKARIPFRNLLIGNI